LTLDKIIGMHTPVSPINYDRAFMRLEHLSRVDLTPLECLEDIHISSFSNYFKNLKKEYRMEHP